MAMTPDGVEQLVARDQLVGARDQHEQDGKGLPLECDIDAATRQSPVGGIDAQITALENDLVHALPWSCAIRLFAVLLQRLDADLLGEARLQRRESRRRLARVVARMRQFDR